MKKRRTMPDAEVTAAALLGFGLADRLLVTLEAKGILTAAEGDALLEHVLLGLEHHLPPDDPGVQIARRLAEQIARRRRAR